MVKIGSKTIPYGILTGLTAAVKLIPLIFVPYLFLIRQFRAMWVTLATFVACGLGLAILAPHTSWLFWTKYVSDANRVGGTAFISNQSLRAVIIRFHHASVPNSVVYVAAIGFGLAGLGLAWWAHRSSSPLLGILVCATTGMVVSPITWAHHMVWVVPILLWLVLGDDRPVGGWIWAVAAALVFWKAPIWLVPYNHGRELGESTLAAAARQFLLLGHDGVPHRGGGHAGLPPVPGTPAGAATNHRGTHGGPPTGNRAGSRVGPPGGR